MRLKWWNTRIPPAPIRADMVNEQERSRDRANEATVNSIRELEQTAQLEQHVGRVLAHSRERVRRNHISEALEATLISRPRYRPRPS